MGMDRAKSLLEVKDGRSFLDLIAEQVLDLRARHGARLPLVLMNSFATREDSLAALRGHEGIAGRRAPGLRPEQGPQAARRRPAAGVLARRPRPGVGAARPRGRVPGAAGLRDARRAARARLPLGLPLQRGQPRRRPRAPDPGLGRARGAALRQRGGRPDRGRPQGRPPRAPPRRRAAAARDRADPRRGRGRLPGHHAVIASSTRTTSGSTWRRCARCSTGAAGSWGSR